jgi:hypothetical protein
VTASSIRDREHDQRNRSNRVGARSTASVLFQWFQPLAEAFQGPSGIGPYQEREMFRGRSRQQFFSCASLEPEKNQPPK